MSKIMSKHCSECKGCVRSKRISQEFEKEGVKVKLSGLKAWVCEQCGEIYFEPGGAEKVVQAVNCLFALALTEKQHKGTLSARVGRNTSRNKPTPLHPDRSDRSVADSRS
jgi:YgiT-type zinc finger domain-containing protein